MYINGLFLLLIWCLGWSDLGFINGLYLVLLLLVGMLVPFVRPWSCVALLVFLLAGMLQYQRINTQFPPMLTSKDLYINACVARLKETPSGLSLLLTHLAVMPPFIASNKSYGGVKKSLGGQVKVTVYRHTEAAQPILSTDEKISGLAGLIGHKVELVVRLKGAKNYQNPHSHNYIRWSQLEGQVASGYVKTWLSTGEDCLGADWIKFKLAKLRQTLWQELQSIAVAHDVSPSSLSLWGALMLGQTSALSSDQWRVLAATGTTHLLVISGLHVGLVALLVMLLVRLVMFPFTTASGVVMRAGAWVGILSALAFALVSGFGLPAQRAVIMLIGLMWGTMWGLQLAFMQRIFIAFFITLILQPNSAMSLGFWLSYTAVLALGLVWYRSTHQKRWHQLLRLLAAQGVLSLVLLPVIAIGTGYVSLVGPLVNIVLVPFFSLLLIPILLLISVLMVFLPMPLWVFNSVDATLSTVWGVLDQLAQLTWVQADVGFVSIYVWVPVLLVSCISLIFRRWYWPVASLLLPLLVLLSVLAFNNYRVGTPKEVIITLLDVGQGLSLWVHQGEQHMLYDVGQRYSSGFNMVDAVILPEFKAQSVSLLNLLMIGHWDKDHSGGLSTLLQQQPVERLVLPTLLNAKLEPQLKLKDIAVSRCQTTPWDNVWKASDFDSGSSLDTKTVLQWRQIALAELGLKGNNASCVVLLKVNGRQLLIAGDIEAKAESLLLELAQQTNPAALVSDILIAPHHGSKTSSTSALLNYVRPAFVLVSAGKGNSYGHPHPQITRSYWAHGSHWYNTGRNGQIKVVIGVDGGYSVTPHLP